MFLYDDFKHLVGRPYIEGLDDCYGLLVQFYGDLLGIKLTNFARNHDIWERLIAEFVCTDGWSAQPLNLKALEPGDGLIFSLGTRTGKPNHIGVYTGNGMFLHHVYGRFSSYDSVQPLWGSRLLSIYRHPAVKEIGRGMQQRVKFIDLLPPHLRRLHAAKFE